MAPVFILLGLHIGIMSCCQFRHTVLVWPNFNCSVLGHLLFLIYIPPLWEIIQCFMWTTNMLQSLIFFFFCYTWVKEPDTNQGVGRECCLLRQRSKSQRFYNAKWKSKREVKKQAKVKTRNQRCKRTRGAGRNRSQKSKANRKPTGWWANKQKEQASRKSKQRASITESQNHWRTGNSAPENYQRSDGESECRVRL